MQVNTESLCTICEAVMHFFVTWMTNSLKGIIGNNYQDIYYYCFHEILLYIGNSVRRVGYYLIMKKSSGKLLVIVMDYMIKYE